MCVTTGAVRLVEVPLVNVNVTADSGADDREFAKGIEIRIPDFDSAIAVPVAESFGDASNLAMSHDSDQQYSR